MKLFRYCFAVFLAFPLFAQKALTNEDVLRMVQTGLPKNVIIAAIAEAPVVQFTFSPDTVATMTKAGVPDELLMAMSARTHGLPIPGYKPSPKDGASFAPEMGFSPRQPTTPEEVRRQDGSLQTSRTGDGEEGYGIYLGSVVGFGGAGAGYISGTTGPHLAFGGAIDVGINRYLGVFAEGGYSRVVDSVFTCYPTVCPSLHPTGVLVNAAAGLEVVDTHRSRFVPYAKVGMGYGLSQPSLTGVGTSTGTPAIAFGGGLRTYFTQHIGVQVEVLAFRFMGKAIHEIAGAGTAGMFFQFR